LIRWLICSRSCSADHELVGVRVICCDEIDAAFHQAGYEMDVSGQAIQLRDDQGSLGLFGGSNSSRELRPIVALAALDLAELGAELAVAAGNMTEDRFALGVQAKTAPTLAIGRDPEVCDVRAGSFGIP
jgi:hypothetical protein